MNGEADKAFELYRWFLPLLRMDTVPNFVQLIKLVQAAEAGKGNAGYGRRASSWWDRNSSARRILFARLCGLGRSRGPY